ncbi:hypothetical protein BO71DRAFT_404852 [Aspergillus ellipticus CBS 707.79]|uniref:Uncharacterized protein n=1 Tax=Aspergillus ellipticus CBS 707.79 TaxID=1448320 RepID=A0A319DR04_9EURO|nr:hypothetical protein BO71DRAFT_404852 [Aspergillus ellipticus CBS 707.79]
MTTTFFSVFVTLPLLTLISIPLVITACITVSLSLFALILRLSIIYIELSLTIIAHHITTTSPSTSTTTKATTTLLSLSTPTTTPTPKRRSSLPTTTTPSTQTRPKSHRTTTPPPPTALLNLISGDEGRDFEGLGGWRNTAKTYLSGSASSLSSTSTTANDHHQHLDDERAWLSINHRLELPSQPLRSTSTDHLETLPWKHRHSAPSATTTQTTSSSTLNPLDTTTTTTTAQPQPRNRHHHRSATTSWLSNSSPKSLSLSNGSDSYPEGRWGLPTSPHQHQHQHQLNGTGTGSQPAETTTEPQVPPLGSVVDGSAGYFSFRPGSGATSTNGSTTPVEERRSPRPAAAAGKFMVHYPAGVRYRRRSLSGPQSSNSVAALVKASVGLGMTDRVA